ncbi:MAG: hypothetical protein IT234_07640 [Bacteroidia bacterium]|nr:hypothetical protein [Bacteroidia bacterium]
MKENKILPEELGLKDLEVFYNPELLLLDAEPMAAKSYLLKKTLLTGAILASLNTVGENPKIEKVLDFNCQIETMSFFETIEDLEKHKESIFGDIQYAVAIESNLTEDEQDEVEILNAYMNNVKKFYPSKNSIPF